MADPVVTITNGVPTSSVPASGVITTLGQTLLDGANITYGATTDVAITAGAAGSISAKLRSISRDIAGGIVLQGGANVIGAVTQSGGPWSVSGTVAATQSGAWNITNITGTISLPTGAATSANQPTNAAIASTTAGQSGHLAMGATTTAAPSYTTGQTNPVSLTTAGALRVDGSGVTQTVSGTVAISGTVPVSQSGVWTMQPGNTANTTPWLITIQQGGNAATVSAGGALKVDGSAVTQPVSAASLPLPSGASTAANQPSNAAQGSTTSGQTGTLAEGAASTGAPTYTNGTTNPLSLTLAGAIRVDNSAVTQPISGTITANQGGTWNQRLQDGSGNAITSDVRGSARPLAVEILDASGNQITSFGAGSGPSFGSAFPANGSAIGFYDGANMQSARVFDGDSGVGTQYSLGVLLKTPASGGAVDVGVSGQPLRVDPTGTTTQPVSGTFWQATQPVSAASLPLPAGASTSANQPTAASANSTTSGQTGNLSFGAVTTGAPSYTTAQSNPLSLTTAGALRVDGSAVTQPISGSVSITGTVAATQSGAWNITNVTGTVSLPTGAATSANQPTNASLGSTTSGQTGNVVLGAVTTGAPSYTTAQSNALSLTTAGALRVDGSAVTQPISGSVTASQGGTWTVQPGNTANTTPWLITINQGGVSAAVTASSALKVDGSAVTQPVSGTVTANQGGNWTNRVVGNAGGIIDFVGQNIAAPANAILIGAEFNTTPTTITSGNASPLQLDSAGNLLVNIKAGAGSGGTASTFNAAFPSTGTAIGGSDGTNMKPFSIDGAGNLKVAATPTLWNQSSSWTSATTINSTISLYNGTAIIETALVGQLTQGTTLTAGAVTFEESWDAGTTWKAIPAARVLDPSTGNVLANPYTFVASTNQAFQIIMVGAPQIRARLSTAIVGSGTVTVAWEMSPTSGAVQVIGTGANGAVPVTGTFWQATQPISAAALPLPSGAATSANQPTNAAIASTTSGQTGGLSMGAVTTAAPAYTTGQTDPLSLTTTGLLRVDGSGVTQPVSGTFWQATQPVSGTVTVNGTITANQGGNWTSRIVGNAGAVLDFVGQNAAAPANSILIGAEFNTTPTTITSGNASPLQLDSAGNLLVNIKAGGGAGGTSSSFGAAIPGTGTAAGYSDGTNMQLARVFDGDSGAGTQYSLGVLLKTPASGGAVDIGVSGQPLRIDPTGTTAQPVTGTFWQATQPVSGTVTANQGGAPWTMKPDGTAWALTGTSANVNVTNASIAVTGTFWQATQPVSIAADVNVKSSTAPVSTMNSASAGSGTTAALSGVFDDVTPTAITENNFGFVRMSANRNLYGTIRDAAGNERGVNVTAGNALTVDASATTQPVSIAAAVTVQQATAANLKGQVDPLTAANWGIGASTQNSAMVANGVMALGQFNTSPTAITTGNMSPLQLNGSGSLRVDGSGVTQPVSGTFWQATQPVSGTVTVTQGTAANLNATVTGTITANQGGSWTVNATPPVMTTGPTWNSSTALNTTTPILSNNAIGTGSVCGSINSTSTITGGQLIFEESYDGGLNWKSIPATRLVDPIAGSNISNPYTLQPTTQQPYVVLDTGITQIRVRLNPQIAGTGTVIIYSTTTPISNFVQISAAAPVSVSQSGAPWQFMGDLFPGGTDTASQWPVKTGGRAATAIPTAVSDGQRVAAMYDKVGKTITAGALRTSKGMQKTSITVATETTVVTAGGAGVFNDVYAIVVTNKSATAVFVDFRDSTAGTVRMTLAAPAGDTRGFTVPVDSAMPQATAANNWTATVSSAVSSIEITMLYVQNT